MTITRMSKSLIRAPLAMAACCAALIAGPTIAGDGPGHSQGARAPQLAMGVERMADGGPYWLAQSLIPLKRDLMLASDDGAFRYGVERGGASGPRLVGTCNGVTAFDDAASRKWSRQVHCGHAQWRLHVVDMLESSAS